MSRGHLCLHHGCHMARDRVHHCTEEPACSAWKHSVFAGRWVAEFPIGDSRVYRVHCTQALGLMTKLNVPSLAMSNGSVLQNGNNLWSSPLTESHENGKVGGHKIRTISTAHRHY